MSKVSSVPRPFTIYTGNEIVADIHINLKGDVRLYEPVPAEYHLGGSHVFNAASIASHIVCENLNGHVSILGTVSTDDFGQHFMNNCDLRNIDTRHVVRVPDSTLVAIVKKGHTNNSFDFPNAATNALNATRAEHLPALPNEEHSMLVMQGVCSSMQPSGAAWLDYAHSLPDTLIIYDVNARPSLIKDIGAHQSLVDEWAAVASVIKISDADIEAIYPEKPDFAAIGERYLAAGTKLVVETRGSKSVRTFSANGIQEFDIPRMERLSNTVGAGDNFMAGLALSFAKAGKFTGTSLAASTQDDIARYVSAGIDAAAEHLRRQNRHP